jgi:putative DNA primase/helicase
VREPHHDHISKPLLFTSHFVIQEDEPLDSVSRYIDVSADDHLVPPGSKVIRMSGRFTKYFDAGYGGWVIPILPPDAKLSQQSKVDPAMLGKVPGVYHPAHGVWAGMADWTQRSFTIDDTRVWDAWPSPNVGMRTGKLIAVDLDDDGQTNEIVQRIAREVLGDAPVRVREGSKRVILLYQVADGEPPVGKMRVSYHEEGSDKIQAVEILGRGQQFVAEGIHPKGGAYGWEPLDLEAMPPETLPRVTKAQLILFLDRVRLELGRLRVEFASSSASGAQGERLKIGDEKLRAPDLFKLAEAINVIPCEDLDYHEWMGLMHAIKAACGGDQEFFTDVVVPWCERYQPNTPEVIEAKWESIHDATVGAEYVYQVARRHGFNNAATDFVDDLPSKEQMRPTPATLPRIIIASGEEPRMVDQAETALLASGFRVFSFGGLLVEPVRGEIRIAGNRATMGTRLEPIKTARLLELFTRTASFGMYRKNGEWVRYSCPRIIAETYLARTGQWRVPVIAGVVNIPIFRQDGTIRTKPGYDEASGLLFEPDGTQFPKLPDHPTRDDAVASLKLIKDELLHGFSFVSEADQAVALAAILTGCARRAIDHTPLILFSAPIAGSGKGLLVDIVSIIADGRKAAVVPPAEDEELTKRLSANLLAGYGMINIDNVEEPLGGATLCAMLTQSAMRIRPFGRLEIVEVPCGALITATGNNLTLKGDMRRRTVLCRLDPKCEHPEDRQFDFDPCERVQKNRGRYVTATLTVLRAYCVAGRPGEISPFGSFESWSNLVRGALVWCGEPDPKATTEAIRAEDSETNKLRALIDAWRDVVGDRAVTARELISSEAEPEGSLSDPLAGDSEPNRAFREALAAVATDRNHVSVEKLGYYLRSVADRIVAGYRIIKAGMHHGSNRWRLEQAA